MRTPGASVRVRLALGALLAATPLLAAAPGPSPPGTVEPSSDARPNILWITSEDNGPQLGAYGDRFATTPNLDRLAADGIRYLHAWSTAPVCAPARTAIISGMYPSSTGSEHMRSMVRLPASMRMFPSLLRQAGYYTTNNVKEDYNLEKTGDVWDESSDTAHWRNRRPGQPFFAVFNITVTHESQIRTRPHTWVHDPAKVRVPAYHPDTIEVRQDWAQYYDRMTEMDALAGARLRELEAAGLADDTIVVYFGDHGPGLPRLKRWPYNSGLHVPVIVRVPAKFAHLRPKGYVPGGASTRLVGFVDLAPTMVSVAGVKPPAWMQGRALMGPFAASDPIYAFGLRGRMDEAYDLVRSVRDERYVYVRQYMPHRAYGQYLDYMFQTPTTRVWKSWYDEGRLVPPQTHFWEPKPSEELYDLQSDRDEVRNLAASPAHAAVLERLRRTLDDHLAETRDVGFLPEYEMRQRSRGSAPYDVGHDRAQYDFNTVHAAARAATDRARPFDEIRAFLASADPAVRYWAATGYLVRGASAVTADEPRLRLLLADAAPGPRLVAAEALARFGSPDAREQAIDALLASASLADTDRFVVLLALNALRHVPDLPPAARARLKAMPQTLPAIPAREREYVPRLMESIEAGLR